MSWLDWVILAFVALGVWHGLRLGLIAEALAIAAYVVAWAVASRYDVPAGTFLADKLGIAAVGANLGHAAQGVTIAPVSPILTRATDDAAFVLLFLLTRFVIGLVARAAAALPLGLAGVPNRVLGGALGGVRNLVLVLIAWAVLSPYLVTGSGPLTGPVHASALLPLFANLTAHLPVIGAGSPVGSGVS
jgi:uncharacterized membrane protein required for colicin V production